MEILPDAQCWWVWNSLVLIELVLAGVTLAVWSSGVFAPMAFACGIVVTGCGIARGAAHAKGETAPA